MEGSIHNPGATADAAGGGAGAGGPTVPFSGPGPSSRSGGGGDASGAEKGAVGLSLEALGLPRLDPPPPPPSDFGRVVEGGQGPEQEQRDRGLSVASTLSSNN